MLCVSWCLLWFVVFCVLIVVGGLLWDECYPFVLNVVVYCAFCSLVVGCRCLNTCFCSFGVVLLRFLFIAPSMLILVYCCLVLVSRICLVVCDVLWLVSCCFFCYSVVVVHCVLLLLGSFFLRYILSCSCLVHCL